MAAVQIGTVYSDKRALDYRYLFGTPSLLHESPAGHELATSGIYTTPLAFLTAPSAL